MQRGVLTCGWLILAALAGGSFLPAATGSAPAPVTAPNPAAPDVGAKTAAENAASLAKLTAANQDLLDLLKKQQAVLEDIQYDRRLQNRQISSLEERLQETMQENGQLEAKVARLEAELSLRPLATSPAPAAAATSGKESAVPAKPSAPASYLPPALTEGEPGTKWWHRLFTLSGSDGKESPPFYIQGAQWRVLWHNQDPAGDEYANTSALFINAFPKGDNIPQKVCSKLGSGGEASELKGPGNFSLKIEASGGRWELAVEDFR
jgi:hypothetical protein